MDQSACHITSANQLSWRTDGSLYPPVEKNTRVYHNAEHKEGTGSRIFTKVTPYWTKLLIRCVTIWENIPCWIPSRVRLTLGGIQSRLPPPQSLHLYFLAWVSSNFNLTRGFSSDALVSSLIKNRLIPGCGKTSRAASSLILLYYELPSLSRVTYLVKDYNKNFMHRGKFSVTDLQTTAVINID